MPEPLELPVRLTLLDYFALQAWAVRPRFAQSILIFAAALIVSVVVYPLWLGASWRYIGFDIVYRRVFYAELFLGCLFLTFAVPFALVPVYWFTGKYSRAGRFVVSLEGVKYSAEGMDLGSSWTMLEWVTQTRAAYVLKFKKLIFRIPKREMTPAQREAFTGIAGMHAPAAANRLRVL